MNRLICLSNRLLSSITHRSEEIPMEDFRQSRNSSPQSSRCSSRGTSRSHTPLRMTTNEHAPLSMPVQEHQALSNSPNVLTTTGAVLAAVASAVDDDDANSKETSFIAPKKKGVIETV